MNGSNGGGTHQNRDADRTEAGDAPIGSTRRIDVGAASVEADPPTQALPVVPAPPSAPPSYAAAGGDAPRDAAPRKRRRWPIVAAIVAAVAVVGALIGGVVYGRRHAEALAGCRTAVADFSEARKALLATSDESPAIQKLIRDVLGVDDILDAVAKAATAAEGTVSDEGCAANATIIQLDLVANTLNSATDSLRASTKEINAQAARRVSDAAGGGALGEDAAGALVGGADGAADAKRGLRDAIARAEGLVTTLKARYADSRVGSHLSGVLQNAVDAGRRLADDSGVKDTKLYQAAEATLDEAIDAVNGWIDAQAARAR